MPQPVDKELSNVFEKLNITNEQLCEDKNSRGSELKTFPPQILAIIGFIKDIRHKRQDVVQFLAILKTQLHRKLTENYKKIYYGTFKTNNYCK